MTRNEQERVLLVGILSFIFGLLIGIVICLVVAYDHPNEFQMFFNETLAATWEAKTGAEQLIKHFEQNSVPTRMRGVWVGRRGLRLWTGCRLLEREVYSSVRESVFGRTDREVWKWSGQIGRIALVW